MSRCYPVKWLNRQNRSKYHKLEQILQSRNAASRHLFLYVPNNVFIFCCPLQNISLCTRNYTDRIICRLLYCYLICIKVFCLIYTTHICLSCMLTAFGSHRWVQHILKLNSNCCYHLYLSRISFQFKSKSLYVFNNNVNQLNNRCE